MHCMFNTYVEYIFKNIYSVVFKKIRSCVILEHFSFQKEAPYSSAVTHHFLPNPLCLDNYLFTFFLYTLIYFGHLV